MARSSWLASIPAFSWSFSSAKELQVRIYVIKGFKSCITKRQSLLGVFVVTYYKITSLARNFRCPLQLCKIQKILS